MKFLLQIIEKYKKLEIDPPQWVMEYVSSIPGVTPSTPSTPSTPLTSSASQAPNLGKVIDDTLKVQQDPELAKKKLELDTIYKQVADALKKKAEEATGKLRQASTQIPATTPTTTTPTTVP